MKQEYKKAFFDTLGDAYQKFLEPNFNLIDIKEVCEEVQHNKLTMYQFIWKGKEKLDGIIRKISVKKETIDAKIKGGEK